MKFGAVLELQANICCFFSCALTQQNLLRSNV